MEFASAKQRIFAFLIDFAVFAVFVTLLAIFIDNPVAGQIQRNFFYELIHFNLSYDLLVDTLTELSTGTSAIFFFSVLGVYLLYFVILPILTNGRTIGKFICRILIVKLNETKISFGTMFIRQIIGELLMCFFSFGIFGIISIILMFNAKGHRTIHDRMSNTLVVKAPNRNLRRVKNNAE